MKKIYESAYCTICCWIFYSINSRQHRSDSFYRIWSIARGLARSRIHNNDKTKANPKKNLDATRELWPADRQTATNEKISCNNIAWKWVCDRSKRERKRACCVVITVFTANCMYVLDLHIINLIYAINKYLHCFHWVESTLVNFLLIRVQYTISQNNSQSQNHNTRAWMPRNVSILCVVVAANIAKNRRKKSTRSFSQWHRGRHHHQHSNIERQLIANDDSWTERAREKNISDTL